MIRIVGIGLVGVGLTLLALWGWYWVKDWVQDRNTKVVSYMDERDAWKETATTNAQRYEKAQEEIRYLQDILDRHRLFSQGMDQKAKAPDPSYDKYSAFTEEPVPALCERGIHVVDMGSPYCQLCGELAY